MFFFPSKSTIRSFLIPRQKKKKPKCISVVTERLTKHSVLNNVSNKITFDKKIYRNMIPLKSSQFFTNVLPF